MKHEPITLGDKLAPATPQVTTKINLKARKQDSVYKFLNISLLTTMVSLFLMWYFFRPDWEKDSILTVLLVLTALWLFVINRPRKAEPRFNITHQRKNFLLANDRQGFMRDLRLDAKTVIIDGSNIYHFGRDNGLDAYALGAIAHQLRSEGYRIVCFFDANIFHTLDGHEAFPSEQRHSTALLDDIFGLYKDEIYKVPRRTQADKYVLESLKHLPISFAVTNDKYRDYADRYPTVMKDNQWRKGVSISNNEIKLWQHTFQNPICLD